MRLAVRSQGHKQLNHQEESFVWIEICRCKTHGGGCSCAIHCDCWGDSKTNSISLGVLFIDVKQAETNRSPVFVFVPDWCSLVIWSSSKRQTIIPRFVLSCFVFKEEKVANVNGPRMTPSHTTRHERTNKRTILIHWSIDTRHQWTDKYLFIYFSHFVDDRDCFLEDVLSDQRSNFIEIFSSSLLIKRLNEFRSGELFPIDQPRSRRSLNWNKLERGGTNVYWSIPLTTLSMRWKREIVKHRWFTKTRFEEKNSLAELFFVSTKISSSSFGAFLFDEEAEEEIVEREVWRSSVVVDWRLFCVSEYLCDQWANLSTLI